MLVALNGATRVHYIVGDPIAQVKSPTGVTQTLQERGHNAIVVPANVAGTDLSAWFAGISGAQNVDGVIVTVPHKFSAYEQCATVSTRSSFLHAVNIMRRNADGSWHGDMFDGEGFVNALRDGGCGPKGKRALVIGAGGAGSAIAHALMLAGVARLAICDDSRSRCESLVTRLSELAELGGQGERRERGELNLASISIGSSDPTGFDLIANATPMGMVPTDRLPAQVERLRANMFVACVITAPSISPFVAAARARGCRTSTGSQMFGRVRDLMVDFLIGAKP